MNVQIDDSKSRTPDDFMARLVHELRSPSHLLSSFLGIFRDGLGDTPLNAETTEALQVVQQSSEEMRQLLRSLSKFVHAQDEKQLHKLDVRTRVSQAWKTALAASEVQTPCKFENEIHDVELVGDDLAFDYALQALLDNAIKFREKTRPLCVTVSAETSGDETTIRIADNGIGIESKYMSKCYEHFERLHPRSVYPGAGLGIPTAINCIEHMHGRLRLSSDGESGTCVSLHFATPAPANA